MTNRVISDISALLMAVSKPGLLFLFLAMAFFQCEVFGEENCKKIAEFFEPDFVLPLERKLGKFKDGYLISKKVRLNPENVIKASRLGIFPWQEENGFGLWFTLPSRGVLFLDEIRFNRSLRKTLKKTTYTLTLDKAFYEVISGCANAKRKKDKSSWISPLFVEVYTELHKRGYAHSAEAWKDGKLVGGVYGILVDGVFSAESMFHLEDNASKLALIHLIDHLKARGFKWIDIQQAKPGRFSTQLGGKEIPIWNYEDLLKAAHIENLKF